MPLLAFPSAAALPAGFWRWPHVHQTKEWACKGTGQIVVDTDFLDHVEKLRLMYDRPLRISSGYRSPSHNAAVSSSGTDGPHTTARAIDVLVYGAHAYDLVALAIALGFQGIGVQQKGPHERRYVHLDAVRDSPAIRRPMMWSY